MALPIDEHISTWIQADWGLGPVTATLLTGGMNSRVWLVTDGRATWVAKSVPSAAARRFTAGLAVATRVQAAGIPTGAPIQRSDGTITAEHGDRVVALLSFVDGAGLTRESELEQRLIGTTLGRAHRALLGADEPSAERFHWLEPDAPHLGLRSWLRPAIVDALAVWDELAPESLTWGLLHSDPAPEAFLLADDGTCGLIDWDLGLMGPVMYDVASAVMYVGGPAYGGPLIDAYTSSGVLGRAEIERTLAPLLRVRWAVQADYFAMRLTAGDLTGIADTAENEEGLEDARSALSEFTA